MTAEVGSDRPSSHSNAPHQQHGGDGAQPELDHRRWWALAAVATAQLMIGIDSTIMHIALPSAQRSLHLSDPGRQWVITIFALAYGGLVLLGGRLSDLIGRKRSLMIGLSGFALASAFGGAAVDPGMLLAGRALQGIFGALLTPSVVATLAHTFPTPKERGKAFGIYGTVMGSSTGLGVLLGGVLTEYLDWRWSMFVNVPIAVAAGAGVLFAVHPTPRGTGVRVDVVGALLATAGLMALVFGFARAETDGWGAPITVGPLAFGVLTLVAFVWVQARVEKPLLPLRVVRNRRRGGSYLSVFSLAVGMFTSLFFLTFYLQNVLDYPPVKAGLAFLPLTAGLVLGARIVSRLLARTPVRALLCPGLLTIAAGLTLLGLLRVDSAYWLQVLPVFLLIGLGSGWVLITANSTATLGAKADTAVAGAMVMTSQQIGASLGTALLSTVAGTATASYLHAHPDAVDRAAVHGLNVASFGMAGFLCLAALVVFFIIGPTQKPESVPADQTQVISWANETTRLIPTIEWRYDANGYQGNAAHDLWSGLPVPVSKQPVVSIWESRGGSSPHLVTRLAEPDLELADSLSKIDGMVGVVLGDSQPAGARDRGSVTNLGLYYRGRMDIDALRLIVTRVAEGPVEITEPGWWGPWADGGGWLTIRGRRVAWTYRNLDLVDRVWNDCMEGRYEVGAHPGHPLGFYSHTYIGEVALRLILADRSGHLHSLQEETRAYPTALSQALVFRGVREAAFAVQQARKGAATGDVAYAAGCLLRIVGLLCHALFGHAHRWLIDEDGIVDAAGRLPNAPPDFAARANALLTAVGHSGPQLFGTIARAEALVADVAARLSQNPRYVGRAAVSEAST